jgi:hypothetical protein
MDIAGYFFTIVDIFFSPFLVLGWRDEYASPAKNYFSTNIASPASSSVMN